MVQGPGIRWRGSGRVHKGPHPGEGGEGGGGGEWRSISLPFENSIVLIKCTLYDTVFQRLVNISRGVAFFYYFVIYCAANHGIWCSVGHAKVPNANSFALQWNIGLSFNFMTKNG